VSGEKNSESCIRFNHEGHISAQIHTNTEEIFKKIDITLSLAPYQEVYELLAALKQTIMIVSANIMTWSNSNGFLKKSCHPSEIH